MKSVQVAKEYAVAPKSVTIGSPIPFKENHRIQSNIIEECTIESQLPFFVNEYGDQFGVDVQIRDSVSKDDSGAVLVMEITDAISQGNAFLGHRKYAEFEGILYNHGEKIASFRAGRYSVGGAFAGFKGSCSVLGRIAKAVGKDIAIWLKKPWKKAVLGDL